jgi:multicomponent Na+:H+ antiporter subunit E
MLMLVWVFSVGQFTLASLLTGFLLGFVVVAVAQRAMGQGGYLRRVRQTFGMAVFFLKELVVASLLVAYEVVTATERQRPGIVAIPLDAKSDAQITLLSNLITLTPGTLTVDVSEDRSTMYVHGMFVGDPDEFRRQIKEGFERRVMEVIR